MAIDVPAIQRALQADGLDGWLLFDFHGSNPIATRLAGLTGPGHMTTRRWFYLIPAEGAPRGLVHAIERRNLDGLPGEKRLYARREELNDGLTQLLTGIRRVAMEYSPCGAIPYLSRVDAGTLELVKARGVEVVSSGDLAGRFEAAWNADQLATHLAASEALHRIKDRAFESVSRALRHGVLLSEYDLQQQMVDLFDEEGLDSDSAPVVAVGANAGDPHYLPDPSGSRPLVPDEVLLLDLWGKIRTPGAVFADITWVAVTADRAPVEVERAFQAVVGARDAAVALVEQSAERGEDLRGWQVDREARAVLERQGYGAHVLHRTGHSLGETVHGNGVHLDDYETHDDRRLLPGTGFTIEPGLYFETFGVRTEINMFRGARDARVSGPRQMELVTLR